MIATATFAGGCFWCVEHDLRAVPGVVDVVSGYVGERESVQVIYDSGQTSFRKLCQFFLDHIDPTDAGGQFYDRGKHYQTAIFYASEGEKKVAEDLIQELTASGIYDKPIVVQVLPIEKFETAEEYHQHYADKNPEHYSRYRTGSGREAFVQNVCQIRDDKKISWKD